MRFALRLIILGLAACFAAEAMADDGGIMEVRGFNFDFRAVSAKKRDSILPSINKQIDIVERAHVPEDVLAFFKTMPIIIDPNLEGSKGHAQRIDGQQTVKLQDMKLPDDRPILLHEFLHCYMGVKLQGKRQPIVSAFRQAQSDKFYPKQFYKAHFLENPGEYFAVIGSIYLYGRIEQPPFDCAIVRKHQPDYIAFLAAQFGQRECR